MTVPLRPPRARRRRRGARVGLYAGAALAMLVLVAVFGAPIVVRGPLLASLVRHWLPPLCGRVDLAAASVEPAAIARLLVGLPFRLEVRRLSISDPQGRTVASAAVIRARVRVEWDPRRLTVLDLRVGPGSWRAVSEPDGRLGIVAAFDDAAHCAARGGGAARARPRQPRPDAGAPASAVELVVQRIELVEMDVTLDFPAWGLHLAHASARGGLRVARGEGTDQAFTFEASGVRARRGSRLRVGGAHDAWAAEVPFDEVMIARLWAPRDRPSDLRLEVTRAATGRAVLAGTAAFRNILGASGPERPGLEVDAGWTRVGGAVAVMRAPWQAGVARALGGEDVDLAVELSGPFAALRAHARAESETARLAVTFDPAPAVAAGARAGAGPRVDVALALDRFETAPRLPPSLLPLLGGQASGNARLHAWPASTLPAARAALDEVDLRLDRTHPGALPPHWHVRTPRLASTPSVGRLDVSLVSATLANGVVAARGFRAVNGGGSLRGEGTLALVDEATGHALAAPIIRARLDFQRLDLGLAVAAARGSTISGALELVGPGDDLALALALSAPRRLRFGAGQHALVEMPARIAARLRGGDELSVAPTVFAGPAGATVEARGTLAFGRRVDAALTVRGWPLAAAGLPAPGGAAWGGKLDAAVTAKGPPSAPSLRGAAELRGVVAAGAPLGDGRVTLAPASGGGGRAPRGVAFEGRLGPHLAASGQLRWRGGDRALQATVRLDALALDPWLARVAPLARATVTGDVGVDVALGGARAGAPAFDARLSVVELGWGRALALTNGEPLRVHGTPGAVVLEPCRFEGPAVTIAVDGHTGGGALEAGARGAIGLTTAAELLPASWRRAPPLGVEPLAGELAFEARLAGPAASPALRARVAVQAPLALAMQIAGRQPARPPLRVTIPAGAVTWEQESGAPSPALRAEGLVLQAPGASARVDGQAAVNLRDPASSAGSWRASAEVDAAALAAEAPRLLARAAGRLALAVRLDGAPRGGRWRATLDTTPLVVTARAAPAPLEIGALHAELDEARTLRVEPVALSMAGRGWLALGAPRQPALVQLRDAWPLEIARVSLLVRGAELSPPRLIGGLEARGGSLALRLDGPDPAGRLLLRGTIAVAHATFYRDRARAPSLPGGETSTLSRLSRRLWLDLRLQLPDLRVSVPGPDIRLAVDCRLEGSLRAPRTSGSIRGESLYTRAALAFAGVFLGFHPRRCAK